MVLIVVTCLSVYVQSNTHTDTHTQMVSIEGVGVTEAVWEQAEWLLGDGCQKCVALLRVS